MILQVDEEEEVGDESGEEVEEQTEKEEERNAEEELRKIMLLAVFMGERRRLRDKVLGSKVNLRERMQERKKRNYLISVRVLMMIEVINLK